MRFTLDPKNYESNTAWQRAAAVIYERYPRLYEVADPRDVVKTVIDAYFGVDDPYAVDITTGLYREVDDE